jgi:hypothetical protein
VILLDAKVAKMKKQIPQIKYSNLKSITSYVADLQGDEKAFKILKNVGKKVITEEEYIMIGFSYIFSNSKNKEFELTSLNKKLKSKKR